MKRKNWLAGLLALTLLLGLSGCGAQQGYDAEQLTVWIWDESQRETWDTLAQEWAQEHHVSVELVVKDEDTYWEELESGSAPDVFWVDTEHAQECIGLGLLHSLDEYLSEDRSIRLEDYVSQLLPAFQSGDKTYAIPKDCSVTALWYNKTLFDNVGLSYPDESWTWEDLYASAQKLTNRHNGLYGLAISESDGADGWYNLVYAYGGSIVSTDAEDARVSGWGDEATASAMELMARLIEDCMPSQPAMAQVGVEQLFAGGHVAMVLQSSGEALTLTQESGASDWGCTRLPYCDRDGNGVCGEGERVTLVTGTAWAVSAKSTDGDAAYGLITALSGEEGQNAQSAANLAQPAMTGLGEDWGVSLTADFSPYRAALAEDTLVSAPVQLFGESWADYAVSDTMYTAWNNPTEMDAMLQKQQQYTASDLVTAAANAAEASAELAEAGDSAGTDGSQSSSAAE